MANEQEYIGEIIESSTIEFAAESRELHSPPPFGSFVKALLSSNESLTQPPPASQDDPFQRMEGKFGADYRSIVEGEPSTIAAPGVSPAIYAVVHQAATTPVDTSKRLRAFWKDEEQLKEEQPELEEWLLVTGFRAVIIGYSANGTIYQFLPPQPPKILSGVHPCTSEEIKLITSRMDFLRTLANSRSAPPDEVVAACIREANAARGGDMDFLVAAGKELANLMRDDYDRLQAIMRRVAL
jgi:hypothetical protein